MTYICGQAYDPFILLSTRIQHVDIPISYRTQIRRDWIIYHDTRSKGMIVDHINIAFVVSIIRFPPVVVSFHTFNKR